MIELQLDYNEKVKTCILYHRWDLEEDQIVTIDECTVEDKGKYLELDDGSGWYDKIVGVSPACLRTNVFMIRWDDIVHQSRPLYPGTSYSGVMKREEHELMRGYRPSEKRTGYRLMKGYKVKYITPRVKAFVMQEIQKKLEEKGITQDWILNKIKDLAELPGGRIKDKLDVLVTLMRAHGVELEKQAMGIGNTKTPLLQQFNQYNIHETRRKYPQLPDKKELKEIIGKAHEVLDEPEMFDNAGIDRDKDPRK